MKKLNDNKRYKQALDLFHKYEQTNNQAPSIWALIQALKSSAKIKDFQSGSDIYSRYSFEIENDSFTIASLINFYG